jgi:hypothetical protein
MWFSDVLPKEAIFTSTAHNIGDFGGSFSFETELDPADSVLASAPELDTTNAADVFELQSIVAGGVDFSSTLAFQASCFLRSHFLSVNFCFFSSRDSSEIS